MWPCSVCFLCVKTFNKENIENHLNNGSKLKLGIFSKSFPIFCERFLKLPSESPLISISKRQQKQSSSRTSSSSSCLDQFCFECLEILQATVKLYNELFEIQLKMAWRLGQWEALLKPSKSKPSSKLSSLLHQKLSKQLELNLGVGGTEEVVNMRSLLLSHCKTARNQMLDHRKLEVALDRSSVPFPVATQGVTSKFSDFGTTSTSFLVLDSNPAITNEDDDHVDVVVKRELDDQQFECTDDLEDSTAMDFETDDDFLNTNPKQELAPAPSSSATVQETVAAGRLRRSTKNKNFCYFTKIEKPHSKKVKVEKDRPKKVYVKIPIEGDGFPCQLCGRAMANLKILRKHLHVHVNKRFGTRKRPSPTFQCRFCWKSFIFKQQRWIHEQIETHDKGMTSMKFTCYEDVCNGSPPFSSFDDLEAHFENVHQSKNEVVHKCSICQWPFTSNDMRQIHELIHRQYIKTVGNPSSFKCPKCEKQGFSAFSVLRTHFISEHTNVDDVRIYKCHKCSNSYIKAVSLEGHLKTHEMEEDLAKTDETVPGSSNYIACEECGKRFATSRILTEHKHDVHRTVQCTLCGKIVLRKRLLGHMKQHSNKDAGLQLPCPICHKMFLKKESLKQHMKKVHPEGKESEGEVCHICSKKYQRKGLLHRHLRIAHQIEAEELKRPARFVCPDCGMGYYFKSSLDNHVDAKHRSSEERKYHFPCTLCSKTFCRKCLLMKHLEEAHPEHEMQMQVDKVE